MTFIQKVREYTTDIEAHVCMSGLEDYPQFSVSNPLRALNRIQKHITASYDAATSVLNTLGEHSYDDVLMDAQRIAMAFNTDVVNAKYYAALEIENINDIRAELFEAIGRD